MDNLRFVLAGAAAAICGLLAYGIAPSNGIFWALVGAVVAFGGVVAVANLSFRADDRDPTIRPTDVTRGDKRNRS